MILRARNRVVTIEAIESIASYAAASESAMPRDGIPHNLCVD